MRLLEVVLLILEGVALIAWQRTAWRRPLAGMVLAALIAQVAFEGFRWQLAPALVLAVVLLVAAVWHPPVSRGGRIALWSGVVLLGAVAVFLPAAFPVPRMPDPQGTFAVGQAVLYFRDESRTDPYAPEPSAREFGVYVWYPAVESCDDPLPYLPADRILARAIADYLHLPSFFLDHVPLVRTHTCADAPMADGRFPVLIFSHGWAGFYAQNTIQAEVLAAHGYVVLALDHPYGATVVVFPDGRVAYLNRDTLPGGLPEDEYRRAAQRLVTQWSGDVRLLLDRLPALQDGAISSPLAGHLDVERIGMFGHSTGGGNIVETCFRDPRCDAALLYDPWLVPVSDEALEGGVSQPMLVLRTPESISAPNRALLEKLLQHTHTPAWDVIIAGTRHYDFTDLPMLSPLAPALGLKGPIPGERVVSLLNRLTLAFFDATLKGASLPTDLFTEPEFTVRLH